MGEQWLNEVRKTLRNDGWPVEDGYPGKSAVSISRPVAAANLTRYDTGTSSAGITVTVMVPRSRGLAVCQRLAARTLDQLAKTGGDWKFDGWDYDSALDCFRMELEGTASFLEQGYEILIGETEQLYVTEFTARKDAQRRLLRGHGEAAAVGVTPGMEGWSIALTQLFPAGVSEPEETGDAFTLTVRRDGCTATYLNCCWGEYESRQQRDGTLVLRRGFALSREVS